MVIDFTRDFEFSTVLLLTITSAVVKRRIHKVLNKREIEEGSIVILKEYKLATAKRLHGDGEVA